MTTVFSIHQNAVLELADKKFYKKKPNDESVILINFFPRLIKLRASNFWFSSFVNTENSKKKKTINFDCLKLSVVKKKIFFL